MEWGTVENVGGPGITKSGTPEKTGTPVSGIRVDLVNTYVDPVVVVSIRYFNNLLTVVPRVTNVFTHSFDVYLQDPSGGPVAPETVDYIVAADQS